MERLFGAMLIVVSVCGCNPDTDVPPERAYAIIAETSVPASVTGLQANGAMWQDYCVYVRFTAPPEVVESILSLGYTPTRWSMIAGEMNDPTYTKSFAPPWSPETIVNKQCYVRDLGGTKPVSESHYLVVDSDSGTVYAVGGN